MNDTYLADRLDELVTAEPPPAWDDVLRRARRSRRRYGALVAVVAVFVLVPTAWAVNGAFDAPPPPDVTSAAAAMNRFAPQAAAYATAHGWPNPDQYGTTADVSKLRGLVQVQTPNGPLDVWGAPSSNGGLCYFIQYQVALTAPPGPPSPNPLYGGCTQPGGLANNYNIETDSMHGDVYLAFGYTDNTSAVSAQVTMKIDGNVLSKTAPVVDGFYLAAFPRDPSATTGDDANIGIEKVVTYDANGNEVETWQNPWQIPCPKPEGQGACTPATP